VNPLDPPKGVDGAELDRLFHGPLEKFTSARNELAKSLRPDDAAAAGWVKSLGKPTRAAWLVNQLAERKPEDVASLLEAGQREQKAIDSLLRTAEALGREHGVGSQILTRVGETLQAASSDPAVAEAIERGRLTREQRAASIGLVGPATPAVSRPGKGKGKGDEARRREVESRALRETAKRRQAAERKLASAEKRLERERSALEKAREEVSERDQRVRSAELDANAARRALNEI
jgi:hypothetical protein